MQRDKQLPLNPTEQKEVTICSKIFEELQDEPHKTTVTPKLKLEKSQFLLDTLLPPLTLDLVHFSKNCDFSNFSQFLEKSQFLLASFNLLLHLT